MPPGPLPKNPSARQRRNRASTNTLLHVAGPEDEIDIPKLFRHPHEDGWHQLTLHWWVEVWRSPMRTEFTDADREGLMMLAMIVNDFFTAKSARDRLFALAEVRLQSVRFGLSPIDRRRLQWEVERTDEAQRRGRRQRSQETPKIPDTPVVAEDPRAGLYGV
jgi:hypothetical protein